MANLTYAGQLATGPEDWTDKTGPKRLDERVRWDLDLKIGGDR